MTFDDFLAEASMIIDASDCLVSNAGMGDIEISQESLVAMDLIELIKSLPAEAV